MQCEIALTDVYIVYIRVVLTDAATPEIWEQLLAAYALERPSRHWQCR